MKPENNGKYIYIITSAGSTIADSTNPLKTVYPNLFDEVNIKSDTTLTQNPYNGESYIKSYYDQELGLKNGFYKEVIDLIESQPIKATIVDGHSITKSYPAGSVFYIQNNVPIQDDIRIRGIFHIKGINFTGRSDQLKLKSYSYINTYYSRIFRHLIESSTKDIVIHLTAVPDDEITYRAIAAAVDTQLKIASSDNSSIQFNLPMSADDYNKYIAMGPPIESTQVDPTPDKPIETRIAIPTAKCGKIKGTGGTTIKMLASLTLAEVTLKGCDTRSKDGTIIINGRKKDVDIVEAKVNELLGKISPPPPSTSSPVSSPKLSILNTIKYAANTLIDAFINNTFWKAKDAFLKTSGKPSYTPIGGLYMIDKRLEISSKIAANILAAIAKNPTDISTILKKETIITPKSGTSFTVTGFSTIVSAFIEANKYYKTLVPTDTSLDKSINDFKTAFTVTATFPANKDTDFIKALDHIEHAASASATKGGVRNTLKRLRQRVHAPKRKSLRSSRRTLATDRA
jgi:hypothetical protein